MPARRAYATDLSDDEWRILEPLVPKAKPGGRPRAHETCELLRTPSSMCSGEGAPGGCFLTTSSCRNRPPTTTSELGHAAEMAAALDRWHHVGGGKEGSVRGADRKGDRVVQPTRVLPVVSVLSLVSVEYGGWALLGFLTGRGQLGEFREKFFRAGHAHAGVLLVLSLVYYLYLDRTGYSNRVQWLAGGSLLAGILAQSGGFFIHLGLGEPNRSSLGTVVTRSGALLIAVALVVLAVGLIGRGRQE